MNRVVVTGMGVVSPLGLSTQETWQGLMKGSSGVAEITHFDTSGFVTKFAAQVKGFDPNDYMDRKDARRMDRFCQFAVAAALQATKSAGIKIGSENGNQIGVIIGSGIGGISSLLEQHQVLLEKGVGRVSPFLATMMIPDIAAGQISIMLGAKGPNLCTVSS
ncbi:MAG: beta-ketoacyl synthase N-terminal-like domain-containing protein, partial [Dehalococcoidia bacterium]|nr:beta-ketoacyl synthase N-terminal-like domain-containing protein [Dehalococcoidia bacterium]